MQTVAEAFRSTVAAHGDRIAVRTLNDEVALTWAQLRDRADALSAKLARLGVARGDTVALMLGNSPAFHVADLAAMTLGATPFSIYLTSSPEQVAYVIRDAGARVAIVEPAFAPRGGAARRPRAHGHRGASPTRRSTPSRTGAPSRPTTCSR